MVTTVINNEPVVRFFSPMPQGYIFVPKGDVYITKNCRKLTHNAGQTVYLVTSAQKLTLGIRIPSQILAEVQNLDAASKATRAAAVQKKDALLEAKVRTALTKLFPQMPDADVDEVLKHTLKKRSGRVGRATDMPVEETVQLAVRAFIRHKHTDYDKMLDDGKNKDETRRILQPVIDDKVRSWGGRVRTPTPIPIPIPTSTSTSTPMRGRMASGSPKRIPIRSKASAPTKSARKRHGRGIAKTGKKRSGTAALGVPVRGFVKRRRSSRAERPKRAQT